MDETAKADEENFVEYFRSETPPTTGSASLEEEVARPTTSTQHSYNSNSATGPQMTYSSLVAGSDVSPGQNVGGAKLDDDDDARLPFRYSKEQMLQVWRDGGGQGELNIEVERWPGIVRELVVEPAGLREWTAEERK
ncbi:uncharacterized protein EI90DRAFT_3071218, partial [Cantharellus anzutake]|uniref:uncharacterized protein n=1 Tax=Cantharellus anzutake TaxID=1750568 RepID=UPI001908F8D5